MTTATTASGSGNAGPIKILKWIAGIFIIFLIIKIIIWGFSSGSDSEYQKTLELQVSHLGDQKLCGVESGERKFRIPHRVHVAIRGTNYEISGYVRVNNSVPGEKFKVGWNGCVNISFAVADNKAKKWKITPQLVPITFQ